LSDQIFAVKVKLIKYKQISQNTSLKLLKIEEYNPHFSRIIPWFYFHFECEFQEVEVEAEDRRRGLMTSYMLERSGQAMRSTTASKSTHI